MKRFTSYIVLLAVLLTVVFACKVPETLAYSTIDGYIININMAESRIEVEDYRGYVRVLNIAPGAVLLIDDTPAALNDFRIGMEVYAHYLGNSLTRLESWSTENPGYIPPGGKVRTGIIKSIDRNQLILQLTTGRDRKSVV